MAGRPPAEKSFKAMLDKAIAQDPKALRRAADKLLQFAADGEAWAIKELADRLDGKPAQALALSGEMTVTKKAAELTDDELAAIVNGRKS